jgi:hypothetical protein
MRALMLIFAVGLMTVFGASAPARAARAGQCVVAKINAGSWVSGPNEDACASPIFSIGMTLASLRRPLMGGAQMGVYEDNFGFWDIDGPEERALFEHVQRQSVYINCERCECSVRLIPPKTLCATCVSALECGAPASMNEYGYSQTTLFDPCRPP